ncbi:uncharacterized protein [Mytilus edulis]|uniref:uncharacterized protein n=1 Tax=Mytilus edulis TaxID=6550 RepID=UPI0039F01D65
MERRNTKALVTYILIINSFISSIHGHGRLIDPPGRASMWRYGFNTPVDYNDNQLFCGGYNVHQFQNGGKCGVCGDEYGKPQLYSPPGKFATGTITRSYTINSNASMTFEITASHRGYLEFRICPNNDVTKAVTQECLDQYILSDVQTGGTKFYFNYQTGGKFTVTVSLPKGLTCSHCVIQWRYRTGNSWGCINDDASNPENCGIGKGRQEEFYACADVAINNNGNIASTSTTSSVATTSTTTFKVSTTSSQLLSSTTMQSSTTSSSSSVLSTVTTSSSTSSSTTEKSVQVKCTAIGAFKGNSVMDWWCKINCQVGYCPTTYCSEGCSSTSVSFPTTVTSVSNPTTFTSASIPTTVTSARTTSTSTTNKTTLATPVLTIQSTTESPPTETVTCVGTGAWKGDTAMTAWCDANCKLGHCPPSHCQCLKDGSLTEITYGLGDKCVTVMPNISTSYKLYMDLWCKHNCPSFGCWNIPHICVC